MVKNAEYPADISDNIIIFVWFSTSGVLKLDRVRNCFSSTLRTFFSFYIREEGHGEVKNAVTRVSPTFDNFSTFFVINIFLR